MSEIKHAFRVMVIDIEEDKLILDEFCDAIIAGLSRSEGDPKKNEGKEFCAAKCYLLTQSSAIMAAERSIQKWKKIVVETFMRDATPDILAEILGGEEKSEYEGS